jgi:hypothetical protein
MEGFLTTISSDLVILLDPTKDGLTPAQIACSLVGGGATILYFTGELWSLVRLFIFPPVDDLRKRDEESVMEQRGEGGGLGQLFQKHRELLRLLAELALIMLYFFLCDRIHVFSIGKKKYESDFYWFFWILLLGIGGFTFRTIFSALHSSRPSSSSSSSSSPSSGSISPPNSSSSSSPLHAVVKPLQRDQTDEWKGWMQLMFLLYHYFNASSIYNAIRTFIAAYVWMTGFGNFSYYYIRDDFSFQRFCQMIWRLNFLAIVCCFVLNNQYMLYYICPLHTVCSLIVWLMMRINHQKNRDTR